VNLWKFLTTDIRELNWERGEEVVKTGAEGAKAVFDLAKAVNEQKSKLTELQPYIKQISSLLDVLNSPLSQIAQTAIPFAPIAITIIKLIFTEKELTLSQCVVLVSQAAYLESLRDILKEDPELGKRIGESPASDAVARQIRKLGEQHLNESDVKRVIIYFHETQLAQAFNEVLQQRLQDAGLAETEAKTLTERVARKTHDYLLPTLVETGEKVKKLVNWYSVGGREKLEKRLSIEDYLEWEIKTKPEEKIFDETEITFRDLYIPLQVIPVDDSKPVETEEFPIEEWVMKTLTEPQEESEDNPKVLFIQGEAGRGKSVFTRMFADRVRRELHPVYTPILIRLRDLRVLANNLTDTLKNALEAFDFVQSDPGWLTDRHTRFLFLLDGFDELLLEGRDSGGIKEFIQQIEHFQKSSDHRFLVTGRPLALQGIERLLSQTKSLARVAIQPMDDDIRKTWLGKWATKVGEEEGEKFQGFLQACPAEIQDKLAREPLLLYLLARMHKEQHFNLQMFASAEGIKAKIRIYDESIKWVLEKQRQSENIRLTGLETENLRQFLNEVALCVVQSGTESVNVAMLEARFKENNNSNIELIKLARKQTNLKDEKVLNNLLTTFYIKPASGKTGGSMEFVHKSFGEFLFAERLVESFLDWTEPRTKRQEYAVLTEVIDKQIYDLLGYGNLTPEIVEYLMGLLNEKSEFDIHRWLKLYQRFESFYCRWCDGEFIDVPPEKENLPQWKKEQLKKQLPERENHLGLRQVDVYTGLDVLILLLELHRYAQSRDDLKDKITFYPCGQPDTEQFEPSRLLCIIGYSQCLGVDAYNKILGLYLSGAYLSGAYLNGAHLSSADLSGAYLSGAYLNGADLGGADLSGADLSGADLHGAYLSGADLSGTDLRGADLRGAYLSDTNIEGVRDDQYTLWEIL